MLILPTVIAIVITPDAFAEPIRNPDNGHYYEFITDNNIKWTEAKTTAENSTYNGITGHLVTITIASENTFVDGLVQDNSSVWIGLTDEAREGQYKWVTGETFDFSNWDSNQPANHLSVSYGYWRNVLRGYEVSVEFPGYNDKWNDRKN